MPQFMTPQWPLIPGVRAAFTTRIGGRSGGDFTDFNLAAHVGDDPIAVKRNRQTLRKALGLSSEPRWLQQVHGSAVVDAAEIRHARPQADAAFTHCAGVTCAVLVADCLPILLADRKGRAVAAVHAGWRGLASGVIEAAVRRLLEAGSRADDLQAWLGPCIGPRNFVVQDDVRSAFVAQDVLSGLYFRPQPGGGYLADLPALARLRLQAVGVRSLHGAPCCTVEQASQFFSHRRDGRSGRMAALIWREAPA